MPVPIKAVLSEGIGGIRGPRSKNSLLKLKVDQLLSLGTPITPKLFTT